MTLARRLQTNTPFGAVSSRSAVGFVSTRVAGLLDHGYSVFAQTFASKAGMWALPHASPTALSMRCDARVVACVGVDRWSLDASLVNRRNAPEAPGAPMTRARIAILCVLLSACSRPSTETHRAAPPSPTIGYGTAMADVARRFELLGRAASGGRFELAEYQLGEIEEQFTETLPRAAPPREGHPEVLPAMASAFAQTTVTDLRRAIAARDRARFNAAFERAATACNGCHQASGHGFIEVPMTPGRAIPNVDALPSVSP